eukprot:TRINITY_DN344_c0_g1_i2.p1 TRINITY_DN344_c0_g1~~TRINITY_DN344_c0_g1_i2.p1  ORF type:complete len:521 (-),score=103.93 TRINITY_DN344_c0_g1_i2:163-1725(-)
MTRIIILLLFLAASVYGATRTYDIVVYTATASGVQAAIASATEGKTVAIIEPGLNIGGMVSGGLGLTDRGNSIVIGGNALEFFKRIGRYYGEFGPLFDFEPHAAEDVFTEWLASLKIPVFFEERIETVSKSGTRISSVSTNLGNTFVAKVFIDASYEGDLLAFAGVSYAVGREGRTQYNESYAGVIKEPSSLSRHQFTVGVNPFGPDGKPLPMVYAGDPGKEGEADKKIQSYNYRMCLTQDPNNRVPIPKPANYDPAYWELFRRYFAVATPQNLTFNELVFVWHLQNGKTDINNNGPISTDYINGAWEYPEANWTRRQEIIREHIEYTQAYFYFLRTDPAVPESLRAEVATWGLAKDEFVKTNNWPHQLYVREARRMIGAYVFIQKDRTEEIEKQDTVGLGSYNFDSHHTQRIPVGSITFDEGDLQAFYAMNPFQLPYSMLVPKPTECTNLIVPVCVSSSHVGYCSIRLEPQYMILGQSAGVAASFAIDEGKNVQDIDIPLLQRRLRKLGQYLTPGDIPS